MFYLWMALAGVAGTLARHGLGRAVQAASGGTFPLGTLVVNVLGTFLFGVVYTLAEQRAWLSETARTALLVGFLGAFTTFSTFAHDTAMLLERHAVATALLNLALQNGLGLLGLFLGLWLARAL